MKNIVKISAAGAGKTYSICEDALDTVKGSSYKVLIVTYINRGVEAINTELRKQNQGVIHPRIIIKTWYNFLLSDAIKPYQSYITDFDSINLIKRFDFSKGYGNVNYKKKGTRARYLTKEYNLLHNYSSELVCILNEKSNGKIINRLQEIYQNIYFDEVQDFAGYDIDFLKLLLDSKISITCCGDNKQATFSTHNTTKNKNITGKNIWQFFGDISNISVQKNLSSRRFNKNICSFANKIFPCGEPITSIMTDVTDHDGVYIISEENVDLYYSIFNPQILRYDSRTKIEKYNALNFGACKGETFDRVLIYPNSVLKDFILKEKEIDVPQKYYVGVTRPRYSLAFVLNDLPKTVKNFEKTGYGGITMLKYCPMEE